MILIFVVLGLVPSFAWLNFFLREDIHPEPKKMILKAFIYGALITIPAVIFQYFFQKILTPLGIDGSHPFTFLIFAIIEEVLKFGATYYAIHGNPNFDEPVDAMIYMITAALGFAMVENVAIALNSKLLLEAFELMILRFVGATLLHSLSSGVIGYYWAQSIIENNRSRTLYLISSGIAIASVLHAAFNYSIISFRDTIIFPTLFLIIAALFVFWDFERIKKLT